MVVPIIICCIKEVLTAEGGRGHATISKHLSNMLTENYLRVTHTLIFHVYRISSNLSDTSNYPGHSFGQFSLF